MKRAREQVQTAVRVATDNRFGALHVEEPAEAPPDTIQHALTCAETGGRRKYFEDMESQTRKLYKGLSGTGARDDVRRALAGWSTLKCGRDATREQWRAIEGILGGLMSPWEAKDPREGGDKVRGWRRGHGALRGRRPCGAHLSGGWTASGG